MDISAKSTTAPAPDRPELLLKHVGHTIWDNLPPVLFTSMLVMTAALPGLFLASVMPWLIAWPVLVLSVSPIWAATVAAGDHLLDGNTLTLRLLATLIRKSARSGLRIGIVPAGVGIGLLAAHQVLASSKAGWIAAPFLLGIGLAIGVSIALIPVFSLANRSNLRGPALWLTSAGIAIVWPIPVLGTLTLVVMMVWATMVLGPSALLASAPLGVLSAGIVREAHPHPHLTSPTTLDPGSHTVISTATCASMHQPGLR